MDKYIDELLNMVWPFVNDTKDKYTISTCISTNVEAIVCKYLPEDNDMLVSELNDNNCLKFGLP